MIFFFQSNTCKCRQHRRRLQWMLTIPASHTTSVAAITSGHEHEEALVPSGAPAIRLPSHIKFSKFVKIS